MSDRYQHNPGAFLEGIFIGAVLGGVLGVLFAPQPGEKTRKWLRDIKDENQDVLDGAVASGENLINSAKQSIEDKIKKISKLVEDRTAKNKKNK
ncbi:MAG: YtxH domain-containing protein [Candidatus Margulisbacteria bacterium]|jgi:gas vesicle protein|nr:YtxH domain-containing protein [Candidatus Margulisiibacteriota bacterium]